jgi:hypothetical protein
MGMLSGESKANAQLELDQLEEDFEGRGLSFLRNLRFMDGMYHIFES